MMSQNSVEVGVKFSYLAIEVVIGVIQEKQLVTSVTLIVVKVHSVIRLSLSLNTEGLSFGQNCLNHSFSMRVYQQTQKTLNQSISLLSD